MGLDVTDQLLLRYSALAKYLEWEHSAAVRQLYINFKKAFYRIDVLCYILSEFYKPMELVTLIEMYLYETYIKFRKGQIFV